MLPVYRARNAWDVFRQPAGRAGLPTSHQPSPPTHPNFVWPLLTTTYKEDINHYFRHIILNFVLVSFPYIVEYNSGVEV